MKKSEIVQLGLIVIGILIIVRTIETLVLQTVMTLSYMGKVELKSAWILAIIGAIALVIVVALLIISKSEYLSKRLVKNENEGDVSTILSKSDILTMSILILSMYFVITGFPNVIGSLFLLASLFFDNFELFKETLPKHIWSIVQYLFVVLIFLKSKSISGWIERSIMK